MRGQTPTTIRLLQKAMEEGRWSLEEFDIQLSDPCGDANEIEGENEESEENYSFAVLCESDDEADGADGGVVDSPSQFSETLISPVGEITDMNEINELLVTDGLLDYTGKGRKIARKRAQAIKRQHVDAKKEAAKREKHKKVNILQIMSVYKK
jgi:hypothetical protein